MIVKKQSGGFMTYTPIQVKNTALVPALLNFTSNLFTPSLLEAEQPVAQPVASPAITPTQSAVVQPVTQQAQQQTFGDASGKGRREHPEINPNCRDLGGLGKIRYGLMYRGGLYGGDLNKIKDLGITHEISVTGNSKHLPVPKENQFGGDWRKMTDKQRGEVISKCMQWVTEGKKVYIHCDRGCDRTGVFCAILEGVLGAPSEDITSDFKLSDTKGKGYKLSHPDLTISSYLKKYGGNGGNLQESFINSVAAKYGVDKGLMQRFIKAATDNPQLVSRKLGGKLKIFKKWK